MVEFRKRYRGTPRSVREARRAVTDFAVMCGFSPRLTVDLTLAAGEALANAVEHGNKELGYILLTCSFEEGLLTIEVRDQGHGFDHTAASKRRREATNVRGFGITIMRALMDVVEYRDRGTTVRLTKRLVEEPGSAGCQEG